MQGAAFHDERRLVAVDAHELGDLARHELILVPGEVEAVVHPAPGVELPVDESHTALVIDHERGPAVAHPGIVAGQLDDAHGVGQQVAGILELIVVDAHGDRFELGDCGGHLRPCTLRRAWRPAASCRDAAAKASRCRRGARTRPACDSRRRAACP